MYPINKGIDLDQMPASVCPDAMALANAEVLHCAVLDVRLRGGLVFPAAEILRERGLGIVFYTGQNDVNRLKKEWPEAHVLVKPAPSELLMQAIIEACRQKRQ